MKVTADQLRANFRYDAETGAFTRRIDFSPRFKADSPCGWKMKNGYIGMGYRGIQMYAHRAAWLYFYGTPPAGTIDHINGDKTDNRIANLRDVPMALNGQNIRKPHADNATGFLGVSLEKSSGLYMAQIGGRMGKWTKRFKTPEEAHAAYVDKKREMHAACTL